jgi:hypothetical protein
MTEGAVAEIRVYVLERVVKHPHAPPTSLFWTGTGWSASADDAASFRNEGHARAVAQEFRQRPTVTAWFEEV